MTIDAAPPGIWAFLYPWCRVLRGKLHLEGRTAENSARWEYHWVAVRLPHSPENSDIASLRRIREALDLLARVAIVDNAAWRALLVQQCRVPRDEDDQPLDCELQPRFRFVFNEKFLEPGALSPAAVCRQFFIIASAQRVSDDYLEALQSLAEVETSSMKTRRVTPIPFELQFELVTLSDDILDSHLRDLTAMLDILQVNQRCDASSGGLLPLALDSIRLDVGAVTVTWSLTQRLTRLLNSGLTFSLFALSLKAGTAENYGQMQESVGRFLRTVLCGEGRRGGTLASGEQGGVNALSVGCQDCDEWQFAALCSALGSATVTKHLRLYGVFRMSDSAEVRRWKWQWLTYALFRTTTESTVARALITAAQLTREDTLAIAVAIHSNSPPTVALNAVVREENMLNIRDWRRDNTGYFFEGTELTLYDPEQEENEDACRLSSIVLETDSWLHIVNDDGYHLDVVLPGFGVARADKLRTQQIEQRQQVRDDSSFGLKALILALGLHFGDDGGEVLTDFLNLIGTSLQSLALYAVGSYPISMTSISHACPQLTDLFLEGIQLVNPSDFCLDAERTKSKLSCLGLVNVFSSNEQITRLAETIASPTSHMAQHLSELGLSGSEESCTINEANVRAFLAMLNTNRKLTYLSLGMSPELQTIHNEEFLQHHGESLPVVQDKLSIPAKIAFLSAVRGQKLSHSVASSLDDSVLSLILAFAATCATRVITIHYDD